ncbi:TonB-dependent receptor plug domain-containing protein [Hymenobacter aerilatus]|uniref:TonB-dependent receptor plug domain-containing protein n=1 Tax=Hymenobacter aerilatus TaxID=2932251 RepID=A0A8T9SSG8_9BACT|nr:TonB-dependent receptor plug domain-containing protein [Hymenobacter aerilatus]UOR05078.1 TonB-dependent receptor plug domain-containing protein [Hymenobacter aerilatus]
MKTTKTITTGVLTLLLAAAGLNSQQAQAQSLKISSTQKGTPAYYVDGVLTPNEALNDTKPDNIETVNVLKDKEAVASFGPEAANGAIIVTTKKNKDSEAVKAFNRKHNIIYTPASPEVQKITDAVVNGTGLSAGDLGGRLLLVNDKEATPEQSKIAHGQLKGVFVMDAEKATKRYGAKGKNGAVVIMTK